MNEQHDVVIVGGGIGGSALAVSLARDGLDVLILERQTEYRDKVRGEAMMPWGVAEVDALGLRDVLIDAGGGFGRTMTAYDEAYDREMAEANAVPLEGLVPDVPGSLNVGHPAACEALITAAATAGATVVRGNGDVSVRSGTMPGVTYAVDGVAHDVAAKIVVGADGRQSPIRRQLGLELQTTEARTIGAGMLVGGVEGWPEGADVIGTEGDIHFLVFPRPGGTPRLYAWFDVVQQRRFTGPDRQQELLNAFALDSLPFADCIAKAEPAGPCATYPSTDSWTDRPIVDGVVLVGDAAGWSDPIIGQGLAVAMRDARSVRDVLRVSDDWSAQAFEPFVEERTERMRRIRLEARITTDLRCAFGAGEHRRSIAENLFTDPMILAPIFAILAGPETAPPEAYDEENLARFVAKAA